MARLPALRYRWIRKGDGERIAAIRPEAFEATPITRGMPVGQSSDDSIGKILCYPLFF
jgi:hypothetical protein